MLEGSPSLIIEDDGLGDVSSSPRRTLGGRFPDRVIHILSYSKTLGPDLRLAVLSSSAAIVEQIQSYRSFSSCWTSRLLQGVALSLLRAQETEPLIRLARAIYGERRGTLVAGLARNGIWIRPGSGLCAWIPVASELFALVTIVARRIAVHPESDFSVGPVPYIRVSKVCLTNPNVNVV